MAIPNITKFSGGQSLPTKYVTQFEYIEDFDRGRINIENDDTATPILQPVGGWRLREDNESTFPTMDAEIANTSSEATFKSFENKKMLFAQDEMPVNVKQGFQWAWETRIKHNRANTGVDISDLRFRVGLTSVSTTNPAFLDAFISNVGASNEGAGVTYAVGCDESVGGKPELLLKSILGFSTDSLAISSNDGFANVKMSPVTYHTIGMESDGDTVKTFFDGTCVDVQGASTLPTTDIYVRPYVYVKTNVGTNAGNFSLDYFYATGVRGS